MKTFLSALALLALVGCATPPTVQQSTYGLDSGYAALAPVATAAIKSGKLDVATVAKVKTGFQTAHDALVAASKAEAAGASNAGAAVAVAQAALTDLSNILIQAGVE